MRFPKQGSTGNCDPVWGLKTGRSFRLICHEQLGARPRQFRSLVFQVKGPSRERRPDLAVGLLVRCYSTGWPHLGQNLASGTSGVPQWRQNFGAETGACGWGMPPADAVETISGWAFFLRKPCFCFLALGALSEASPLTPERFLRRRTQTISVPPITSTRTMPPPITIGRLFLAKKIASPIMLCGIFDL